MMPATLLVLVGLATTTTATTATDAPAVPTPAALALEEARAAFSTLDCDRVIERAAGIKDDRLATSGERREAAFLHAYCAVVIGDNAAAQEVFASVVAEDIDAQPPFEMEPRIVVLLEAARAAERERRAAAAAAALAARRAQVELRVERPVDVRGGNRAFFPITLRDPSGFVRSVRLEFRRAGEADFYALPVQKKSDGSLVGEIPGSYTRSENGLTLQWFVAAIGTDGTVAQSVGSPEAPGTLVVGPGSNLAQDLRANERLSSATRMTLGLFATPLVSGLFGAGGLAIGWLGATLTNPALQIPALMLLSGVGATTGTWLVAQAILDADDAAIATAVTGGFSAVWALSVLGTTVDFNAGFAAAIMTAAVGGLASAAVPATLVFFDPPAE